MIKRSVLLGCSLALIIGCGEETTGAKHNPRSDSPTAHSNELSDIATELAKQSLASNSAPTDFSSVFPNTTASLAKAKVAATENINQSIKGDCGGSLAAKGKATYSEDPENLSFSMDMDMKLDDFCITSNSYESTMNGMIDYQISLDSDNKLEMSMDYDLSFESEDPAVPSGYITLLADCSMDFNDFGNDAALLTACSITTSYVAPNGQTYSIKDLEVTNDANGIDMSGEFSGKEGTFDYTAEDLTLCANGNIGSGSITLEDKDSGDTIEVEYISCDEYTVTEDGETTTHEQ